MTILKKLAAASRNHTTYDIGLLQAKVYRLLKQQTNAALAPLNIASVHWALLGLAYKSTKGVRPSEAAREMGVEAPFVTTLAQDLVKLGYLDLVRDPDDSRAKLLCLTDAGKAFVNETEPFLRAKMKDSLKDIGINDLGTYVMVLEQIVRNSQGK
ncbi:MAG TPA: MarR family transcriptional regulator [Candidatus Paceibacterota bacterium]|jgi:DNA-binding MarR family transcriptional regulator